MRFILLCLFVSRCFAGKANDTYITLKPSKYKDVKELYLTTKPTGQGKGLGLSLSYDIIKTHRGELNVETGEGEGSIFIISIPIT